MCALRAGAPEDSWTSSDLREESSSGLSGPFVTVSLLRRVNITDGLQSRVLVGLRKFTRCVGGRSCILFFMMAGRGGVCVTP